VLSQVQDDRIWKDIKCFVEIYKNNCNSASKPAVYRLFRPPIMRPFARGWQENMPWIKK
jgi:hypothetical protein